MTDASDQDASAASAAPARQPLRLWGGAFGSGPSEALQRLSVSIHFDWRLAPYDLRSSRAHARVLHRAGLLDDDDLEQLLAALDLLEVDVLSGSFVPTIEDEDVHTALERGLVDRLGTLGGKLRAGRSRNDQIATDLRLYLREQARVLTNLVVDLQSALLEQSDRHVESVSPGSPTCNGPNPCRSRTSCSSTFMRLPAM